MRLDIRIQKLELPRAVKQYVERRLCFGLSRFERQIRGITIRLFDINGPRGGTDKCCRIAVRLIPSGVIVIQEVNSDLFAAIDRASERAGQTLSRRLHRDRTLTTQRESVRMLAEPINQLAENPAA
jgi:putative sigma-54 modulation protein